MLALNTSLLNIVNDEWDKLNAKRDYNKDIANGVVDYSLKGSAISAALFTPLTFGAGAVLLSNM